MDSSVPAPRDRYDCDDDGGVAREVGESDPIEVTPAADDAMQCIRDEIVEFEKQMSLLECSEKKDPEEHVPATTPKREPKDGGSMMMMMGVVHTTYAALNDAVSPTLVERMRVAMREMPDGMEGLSDCQSYLSSKLHYTLADILVVQYILNGGILVRQRQGGPDEYQVDISSSSGSA